MDINTIIFTWIYIYLIRNLTKIFLLISLKLNIALFDSNNYYIYLIEGHSIFETLIVFPQIQIPLSEAPMG